MRVTTTLGVYYLPRLSELTELSDLRREIVQGCRIILPVAVVCALGIYTFRDFIITLLFSQDFAPMAQPFARQVVGDTLKIANWILSYLMLGKAMTGLFIVSEITFAALFVFLTTQFVAAFGLEGAAMAHAANYLVYGITMAILIPRGLRRAAGQSSSNADL